MARIALSLLAFILFIIAMIFIQGPRNFMLKQVAEFVLSSGDTKVRIGEFEVDKKEIRAKNTKIYMRGNELTTIENIKIDYDFHEVWLHRNLNMAVKFTEDVTLLGKPATFSGDVTYDGKLSGDGNTKIAITELTSDVFSDLGIKTLQGGCEIESKGNAVHIGNCKISDGKAHLEVVARMQSTGDLLTSLAIEGNAKELPIDLHKAFHHVIAEDATMQYLYDNISGAMLRNGSWKMDFDKKFFSTFKIKPEYIQGEFNVENIALAYDKDFPVLTKINTKLIMTGSMLDFQIPSAYSGQTLLSNARVQIDWGVEGDANVIIDSDGKGPAANLTDFIPAAELASLTESGIDIAKIKGTAVSKVHLIVPIGDGKNTYNITSDISGMELNVFDSAVTLSKARLNALFDGNIIKVEGPGFVNDFKSQLSFTHFMDEKAEFDNILDVKTTLASPSEKTRIRAYDILSGSALLEFSYKNKGNKMQIYAKSNLLNAEFGIDKLGVRNKIGDKAVLEVSGETASDGTVPISIKLTGDNNLKIIGSATIAPGVTKVSFGKITAHETDIKADVELGKKSMKAKLRGPMMDLSQSNMMQFLTKNADATATVLDIAFDKVRLKKDIYLDNFVLKIKCDKVRCYEGVMTSKVGTRDFNMMLTAKDDYEEWKITSTNAGAILKGIGMMDNVKSGDLEVNVETRRSEVKAGQPIPIANGKFKLEKFVTVKNKFLTRLIAFTSLPGLMNLLRNNSDISFTKMTGEFSYKDDVVNIFGGVAEGPFMDLKMKGNVFTKERKMKIKGTVSPSQYGPGFVKNIPIIGKVFKVTPYSIEDNY